MKINWRSEIISLFLIAASFILAGVTWPVAPDRIPVHWGIGGEPDRYGGKLEGLLGPPLIALGLYLLMIILPRIDPRGERYRRFPGVYNILRTSVVALMAAIEIIVALWARNIFVNTGMIVSIAVGLLLMVIGNYMGKIRPNWFVGIRTPWTLSSEESWNKTHRLGGKLFVGLGIFLIVVGLLQTSWAIYAFLGLTLLSVIGLAVYSYFIWRNDPTARTKGN